MNALPFLRPTERRPASARFDLLIVLVAGIRATAAEAGQPRLNQGEALVRAEEILARYDKERGR